MMPSLKVFIGFMKRHSDEIDMSLIFFIPLAYLFYLIGYGICKLTGNLDDIKTDRWDL